MEVFTAKQKLFAKKEGFNIIFRQNPYKLSDEHDRWFELMNKKKDTQGL